MVSRRIWTLLLVGLLVLLHTPFGAWRGPAEAAGDDRLPVIIRFGRDLHEPAVKAIVGELAGGRQLKHFPAIRAVAATVSPAQLEALGRSPAVVGIEEDRPVEAMLETATYWSGATDARKDFQVDGGDGSPAYTGSDVVIAVVDTGIDAAHADLQGKVIGWYDAVNGRTTPYDDHGHGTHVASIAAGTGAASGGRQVGVAPGASLVGVKVLDSGAGGTISNVLAGLQWVLDQKATHNIRVVNLSLGASASVIGADSMADMADTLVANGIVVVVAAGNSGPGARTVSSPGVAPDVITVGAVADPGETGLYLATFSSRGPAPNGTTKPDIVAPGVSILAAAANSGSGLTSLSGTSMATPHVAGAAALLLGANPVMTPAEVKSALRSTAEDWGAPGPDNEYGAGVIKIYKAVALAMGRSSAGGPPLPPHQFVGGRIGGPGERFACTVNMAATGQPLAATVIMPEWVESARPNLGLAIYGPSGYLFSESNTSTRQEVGRGLSSLMGPYRVEVYGASTTAPDGDFWLDLSGGDGGRCPGLAIIGPVSGSSVAGTVTITAMVEASAGLADVAWALEGGSWNPMIFSASRNVWEAQWDTTTVSQATHTLSVRAVDPAGVTSTSTRIVTVVGDAVSVTITSPPEGAQVSGAVPVTAQVTALAGLSRVEWALDGGTPAPMSLDPATGQWQIIWDSTVAANASHTLTVRGIDSAGLSGLANGTVTSFNIPLPSVHIVNPPDGSLVSRTLFITVEALAPGGLSQVLWSLDGGAWQQMNPNRSGQYVASWDTTTATNGSHTVSVMVRDLYSQTAVDSVTAVVANGTAPAVSILQPAQSSTVSGSAAVEATVAASGQLSAVQWTVDGAAYQAMTFDSAAGRWKAVWESSLSGAGTHTLTVRAVDSSGLIGQASVTVTVALPAGNTPPVLTAPAGQSGTEGTSASLGLGSLTDPDAGDSWSLTVNWGDGSAAEQYPVSSTGTLGTRSHTYPDNGTYTVSLRVIDRAGAAATATFPVAVANRPPQVVFSAPSAVAEAGSFTIALGSATDVPADLPALQYAFDCGTGFGAYGSATSAVCPAGNSGQLAVGGRVKDEDGGVSEYRSILTLTNVAPAVTAPADQAATAGALATISLGSFTDPGADSPWSVEVDWGDGSSHSAFTLTAPGSLGSRTHTYACSGAFPVTVTVRDKDGGAGSTRFQVTVVGGSGAWSSGDLETGSWTVTAPGDGSKDYTYRPLCRPARVTAAVQISAYSAAGSTATGTPPPYLEVWTVVNGAPGHLLGTVRPSAPGTYQVESTDPAVLADIQGGSDNTLRLFVLELSKRGNKYLDSLTTTGVVVELQFQ